MTAKPSPKFIGYFRVSTARQQRSGLGLAAQKARVRAHVKAAGGKLLGEFVEVESGRKEHRPQLEEAVFAAKAEGATLLIAKLDRLARNVRFLSALMDSGLTFQALDLPEANRLTLHLMASIAEAEATSISERTKAGLQQAKLKGVVLGRPENLTDASRQAAAKAHAEAVRRRYRMTAPLVVAWRAQGMSLPKIAAQLNELRAELAHSGTTWTPIQVSRVLKYAARK
jgi:DNA invertase Pin-like site-specific DNA recombinase